MDYLRARIEALENEVENLKKQVEFLEATKDVEVQKNEMQIKIDKDYLLNLNGRLLLTMVLNGPFLQKKKPNTMIIISNRLGIY
jgi:hypothetical protein